MKHLIKYNKSKKIATIGRYHHTFDTLWNKLPESIVVKLNSINIAQIIDMMYEQKKYGSDECYQELK